MAIAPAPIARLARVFDVAWFDTTPCGVTAYYWAVLRLSHRYGMGEHFDVVRVSQNGIATRVNQYHTIGEAIAFAGNQI